MPVDTKGFRLLVFDWDGTLVDSIGRIVGCTQAALREIGIPPVDDDRIRTAIGLGVRETVERLLPGCDEATFERLGRAYGRLWFESWSHDPQLFAGARRVLAELAAGGYMLAVATAQSRAGLARDLEATGLAGRFHASRTTDEAPPKPHPEMLLGLLDETGTRPVEALMIGDTVHDLQMAVNAAVPAVGVTSGSHELHELERVEALDYLAGVAELPDWLRRRAGERRDPE